MQVGSHPWFQCWKIILVQAKDPEYKAIVQKANDEYTQMYQQVAYKEQELARMREAYQQQLAYQVHSILSRYHSPFPRIEQRNWSSENSV